LAGHWRVGIVNVALGVASAAGRGRPCAAAWTTTASPYATVLAVADDIAAASGLVHGKTWRTPAVIVRGWSRATATVGTD